MKKFFALLFALAALTAFTACKVETQPADIEVKDGDTTTAGSGLETTSPETTAEDAAKKDELTFGSTFVFDDLEITIGNAEDVTWTTIDNEFSENNGKDVIVLPVTVKNLKSESHSLNMFYYKIYGSAGTEADTASAYFSDSDIEFAGDMRSGASITSAFHIVYDGDGDYYIEFSEMLSSEKIEVKLPIAK